LFSATIAPRSTIKPNKLNQKHRLFIFSAISAKLSAKTTTITATTTTPATATTGLLNEVSNQQ